MFRYKVNSKNINGVLYIARGTHWRSGLQLSVLPQQEKLNGTPHFDLEITEENVDAMAKVILRHIKKSWNVKKLQRKDFKGGLANKVFGYLPAARRGRFFGKVEPHNFSDMVLVRVFGEKTDMVKNHEREVRNIDELAKNDLTPSLYGTFSNGFCWEFIEGKVLSHTDLKHSDVLRFAAGCMAELHSVELSSDYLSMYPLQSTLFDNINYYMDAIPSNYNNILQKRFDDHSLSVERLRDELSLMHKQISSFQKLAISYCHNDFHPVNLILNENNGIMYAIDHERGCPNFSAYDIGNFFNEFAGLRNLDYRLYPTQQRQFSWLRLYLQRLKELNGSDEVITNSDVRELFEQVQVMSMVSHLFWVSWALFRAGSPVNEFDYMGYGIVRLNEYFRRKEILGFH